MAQEHEGWAIDWHDELEEKDGLYIPNSTSKVKSYFVQRNQNPRPPSEYTWMIRIRDNRRCCICGRDGYIVHHIIPSLVGIVRGYGSDIHLTTNLATLCPDCHNQIHVNDRFYSLEEMIIYAELGIDIRDTSYDDYLLDLARKRYPTIRHLAVQWTASITGKWEKWSDLRECGLVK